MLLIFRLALYGGLALTSLSAALSVNVIQNLPIAFERNKGQADAGFEYIAHGRGFSLLLFNHGSIMNLRAKSGQTVSLRTEFTGSSPNPVLEPSDALVTETNYIRGAGERSVYGIASFGRVRYRNAYRGIDIIYYGNGRQVEYDIVVAPHARPADVKFKFSGGEGLTLDPLGSLIIKTGADNLTWCKPSIYQEIAGQRRFVRGGFELRGPDSVSFRIGSYDRRYPLVIDPAIVYSTYLGGSLNDSARAISVDAQGNVYIAGYTESTNLPFTANSFQPAFGGGSGRTPSGDSFVAKINPTGTAVIYNTYLGGSGDDVALGLAVDSAGEAYVTGYTTSSNFPVTANGAIRQYAGGGGMQFHLFGDAFIAKLNAAGSALVYSTYLGGSKDDVGAAIALDSSGNAYITGTTLSTNLPVTSHAYQGTFQGTGGNQSFCSGCGPDFSSGDGFVASLNASGSAFNFVTYLGGSNDDMAAAIAVDPTGVYIGGGTLSSNFPTTSGAFQRTYSGASPGTLQPILNFGDAFLAKLSLDGSMLIASTLLGGSNDDQIVAIALDPSTPKGPSAVYVTGFTQSSNFPGASGQYKGPASIPGAKGVLTGDAFVAKFNSAFSTLSFSKLIGGAFDDAGMSIAVDPVGNIIVGGFTYSADFPTTSGALQTPPSSTLLAHGFVLKLDPTGTSLLYSTSINGLSSEIVFGTALDAAGNTYLTGMTNSTNFPVTAGVLQKTFGGTENDEGPVGDTFVMKISGLAAAGSPPSTISVGAVANAASYATGSVSGGEIVSIFGSGMGPAMLQTAQIDSSTGKLSSNVSGTQVFFDSTAAPIIYTSATQLSVVVPYEVTSQASTQMHVAYNGASSNTLTLPVVSAVPGVFSADSSGKGQGAILNQNGTPNSASHPAKPGDIIVLFGTGEGQTVPAGVTGLLANGKYPKPVQPVSVSIGGQTVTDVAYAGAAPTFVTGLLQINVRIPTGVSSGAQPLEVHVGRFSSQSGLTVYVQ